MALPDSADVATVRPGRHRAIVEIDAYTLLAMFKSGRRSYAVVENPIPDDATIYGVQYDALRDCWRIGLEHPSFPVFEEGAMPIVRHPTVVVAELPDDEPTDA